MNWARVCSYHIRHIPLKNLKFSNSSLLISQDVSQKTLRVLSEYVPSPPAVPEPITNLAVSQLNSLGEPTLSSLGLASWYPNGLVQYGLESLHVGLGVPWWSAIVIGTFFLRLVTFPLVVLGQRNAANMHNYMPIMQKLQNKFSKAKSVGNSLETAKAGAQLYNFMKENNVNPLKNMLVPFIQLPIFVSVFVGIRQMANLPVESMGSGGIAWFTDLTSPDPFFILPIMTTLTFYATVELGVDGVRASTMTRTMKVFMRVLPFLIMPFTVNFPAGLLLYWLTSNIFSLIQVLFMKIDGVKRALKIPQLVKHDSSVLPEKKPFFEEIKGTWNRSKTVVNLEERQRLEAIKFKEAGMGALQKTFKQDPKKKTQ
ncbi:hypothetical protein HELRODRAFT_114451 [Helobdella robusta]|uniref:Membrane insertase YidC/Oxa/ALB C-terminal domain-containing protein n=1 Tax=Helobdella robusta TaxID=6412 RepID=T1EG19_HELRO|nr:hypothetical protein HELRODRAFT_114451 [Helobdella robusta]ESN96932.1 hypothetical protein HELRODRAFT_114451 [Helobdella robusta]